MDLIDGKIVWTLHATHGMPLEMTLNILAEKNQIPTWDRLLESAKKDGAKLDRLSERIIIAVSDSYPGDVAAIVRQKLPRLVECVMQS